MDLESFKAASEAAESWVITIADARYFADRGEIRAAYGTLMKLVLPTNKEHDALLRELTEDLAAISDGLIRHNGLGGSRSYTSAHEAILEIRDMLYLVFLAHLMNIEGDVQRENMAKQWFADHADALSMNSSEMRARIRRERAKLLAQATPDTGASEPPPLREQVLAALTENQRNVVEYLWDHKAGASFDTIKGIPGAFRQGTSADDDTIKEMVKKANRRLQGESLPVSLSVSGRRLILNLPPG